MDDVITCAECVYSFDEVKSPDMVHLLFTFFNFNYNFI